MISVPSPFQPYWVLTDEPSTLRCIISEQIVMQPCLVIKILPRQPQRLVKVRPAVADVRRILSKPPDIPRPHQRSICRRHLLRRARHIRVVIPHLPAFSLSRHAHHRRVRLFRIVQICPPALLLHVLLQQPEPHPHKVRPAPRRMARVPPVRRLAGSPPQRIVAVVRLRVAADDTRQLPLRVPLQLLVTPRGQLAPLVVAIAYRWSKKTLATFLRPSYISKHSYFSIRS